jgi:hypothetical protein
LFSRLATVFFALHPTDCWYKTEKNNNALTIGESVAKDAKIIVFILWQILCLTLTG